jgi:hypothetical protein
MGVALDPWAPRSSAPQTLTTPGPSSIDMFIVDSTIAAENLAIAKVLERAAKKWKPVFCKSRAFSTIESLLQLDRLQQLQAQYRQRCALATRKSRKA